MPVIITPAPDPATTRPAQDPQWVARPPSQPSDDQPSAVHHWQALLDAGLIANQNPPAPPEVIARREANDALFRGFAIDRRRLVREQRA